jgi:hypothetical protein
MTRPASHFLVLGVLLFAASRWLAPVQTVRTQRIDLEERNAAEELWLAEAIARGLGEDDIVVQRRLVESSRWIVHSGDEPDTLAAYRDAMTLGLDRGDTIVRQRLVQQMRLLLESDARRVEPSDSELRVFLADRADRFLRLERVRIRHVFFSHARRGATAEHDARALLVSPDPSLVGDPCVWPAELPAQTATDLEKIFGGAAAAVAAAPLREWSGPYRSAYGAHLVWVHERIPAALPAFESVRSAVRLALLHERGESHVRETLATLRQRYAETQRR